MNNDSKAYWRALIGTFLLFLLMSIGLMLMWSNNSWSYLYILGWFNISTVYVIILKLAKSYILKTLQSNENKNKEAKN